MCCVILQSSINWSVNKTKCEKFSRIMCISTGGRKGDTLATYLFDFILFITIRTLTYTYICAHTNREK